MQSRRERGNSVMPFLLPRYWEMPVPFLPDRPVVPERMTYSSEERETHLSNIKRMYETLFPYLSKVRRFNVGEWVATDLLLRMGMKEGMSSAHRILDLCCGFGESVGRLAGKFKSAEVVGLDLSYRQVEDGKRKSGNVLLVGDAMSLPFGRESFGAIWSEDAFSHVPDRVTLFQECHRILVRGGLFIFSDLTSTEKLVQRMEMEFCKAWCLWKLETVASYRCLLKNAGFSVITTASVGREIVKAHEKCNELRGDLSYRDYGRWMLGNRKELIDLWGPTRYRAQKVKNMMYPYLRTGRLDHIYFVARRN